MKKLIMMSMVFLYINFLAQEKHSSINDCFKILKEYTRNIQVNSVHFNKSNMTLSQKQSLMIPDASSETSQKIDKMEKREIMDLARKINNAVLENPVEFKNLMLKDEAEVEQEIKKGRTDLISIDIFNVILKDKMKKLLDPKISEFLTIPLILRVKINQIDLVTHNTTDLVSFALPKTEINCTVNDIVKGSNLLKKGDLLEFYYMNFWKKTNREFIEGEEYCISLAIRLKHDGSYTFPLVTNSKTDGVYLIKNNKLFDETNNFGLDNNIEWEDFKEQFSKRYINF